jgi:hypothetical protein
MAEGNWAEQYGFPFPEQARGRRTRGSKVPGSPLAWIVPVVAQ